MLIDVILGLFGYIIQAIATLLPEWQVWPDSVFNGLEYFAQTFATLDFLIPVATVFSAFLFLVNFFVAYFTAKLITKVANFFRGTGSGIELN